MQITVTLSYVPTVGPGNGSGSPMATDVVLLVVVVWVLVYAPAPLGGTNAVLQRVFCLHIRRR